MSEGSPSSENPRLRLPSGVEAAIRCAQPPLPPEEARRIAQFVGHFLVEEYLGAILLGEFSEAARFTVGMGIVGGSLAAACWSGWGREFPDIAVMGGVATAEAYRGQGLASAVVGAVCERFDSTGGRLLYLGTRNPVAQRIYERLGFRQVAGQIFCRAARGARPDEGFAAGRTVAARPASWRDMASIVPLYLQPHPCVLADAGIGLPSARIVEPRRCVHIFWDLWKSIEPAGQWTILRNDLGWPVASALARPSAPPAAGFSVDFLWHTDYSVEGAAFVGKWLEEIEAASGCACRMLICDGDDWKLREARKLGFERAEGGGIADVDGRKVPLLSVVRQGVSG
jgi:GNAT superfamily N-acetyltransferase